MPKITSKNRVYRSGPNPNAWCTGPDPQRHDQYIAWGRSRAQAHFRQEDWRLTFEQYEALWQGLWSRRGRGSDDLMMMRLDWHKPWNLKNTIIADRQYYHWRQNEIKLESGRITQNRSEPGKILRTWRDL